MSDEAHAFANKHTGEAESHKGCSRKKEKCSGFVKELAVPSHAVTFEFSKDIFHDNKSARAMQLDNDLQTIKLGSLSITEYFHKIKRITDMLANIDSPVDEKNLIAYA
ncbi:hybrid signal transduction histidine kinase M, partial [Tanacetum coccineum]